MIEHVLARPPRRSRPRSTTVVVGHQADALKCGAVQAARASRLWSRSHSSGTGHALLTTEPALRGRRPARWCCSPATCRCCRPTRCKTLVDRHSRAGAAATVLTAVVDAPVRLRPDRPRSGEQIARIVEERDATPGRARDPRNQLRHLRVRARRAVRRRSRRSPPRTRRASTTCPISSRSTGSAGCGVETVTVANADEIRGINSRTELAEVSRIVRQQKNEELMAAGVTLDDPATTYIDADVVSRRRHGDPSRACCSKGTTTIGAGCEIHAASRIVNSTIGDRVRVSNHCVITDSHGRRRARSSVRSRTCGPARRSARTRTSATSSS